jgi:cytosine/adenosine deaminase-related metal-dependent hydrolase
MTEQSPPTLLIANAGYIATVNDQREVLADSDILIVGNRIAAIGPQLTATLETPPDRVIDATGMVVLPGMVATHDHLFQTLYRGVDRLKKRPIVEWVATLCELLDPLDAEAAYSAASVGLAELLLSGCTTTSDHLYVYPHGRTDLFDAQVWAAQELGIRFHPVRGSLGIDEQGQSMWPAFVCEDDAAVLAHAESVLRRYHDPDPYAMVQVALGPCGYYSASRRMFSALAELAERHGARLHTHALEMAHEQEDNQRLFGRDALEFLDDVGFLGPHAWLAHGVYARPEDIERLAATRTAIAYTPWCTTSKKRVTPITAMCAAGVPAGIAPDGAASNDGHNMLSEARLAGRLQGLDAEQQGVSYWRATQILELATRGGARCLGRERIGSIAVGKAADLAIIDTARYLACAGCDNPLEAVFHTALAAVDYTIVNGCVVVDQGHLVHPQTGQPVDLAGMVARHNRIAACIRQQAAERLSLESLRLPWTRILPDA